LLCPRKTSRAMQAIKGVAAAAVESRQAHAADDLEEES
jgi:hypothetical protein